MTAKTMAEVLAEHQWYDATSDNEDPAIGCTGCDEWFGSEDALDDGTFAAHQAAALTAAGFGLVGEAWPEYEWACQIGGLIYPHSNEADARRDATFKGKHERKVVRRIKAGAWEDQS